MERKPEREVIEGEAEVSAYASAATQEHLDSLDNTFVDQVLSLGPPEGTLSGRMLDVGCGPGNIVPKIAQRYPSRLAYPWHVRWHGRHYSGIMKKLFEDSVRAAYTPDELADLLSHSRMSRAHIFIHERAHMGFVYRGQKG
ncbi:MAG: hypothetical protein P8Z30_14315 [Acidobacteriota bacterium]